MIFPKIDKLPNSNFVLWVIEHLWLLMTNLFQSNDVDISYIALLDPGLRAPNSPSKQTKDLKSLAW